MQLFESNNIMLQCVTGYTAPPADVYWWKDGAMFLQGTQEIARLIFEHIFYKILLSLFQTS